MYYKELETNAELKHQHNDTQRKVSTERLKKVAALKKLKKQQKENK